MVEVTRTLAEYIVGSRYSDIPEAVRTESIRTFVNWMGCVVSGSTDGAVERAMRALAPFAGPEQATVIGLGRRFDIGTTAFLNTLSNFIHSYNDTHLATVAHPTGAVASALLAMAEHKPMTGEDFLHALIIGIEIECRLANMIAAPPAECHFGLSTAGMTSVFGAAVAAGIILRLDEDQMVWALGNAVAQASGVRSTHGSMASHVIPAHGSRNGIVAAWLAREGFECSERSIEGPKGFAEVFAIRHHLPAAVDRLGEHYEFMANVYKPFPCGVVNHAPIDACLRLLREPGFDSGDVAQLDLRVHPLCVKLADRPSPRHRLEALVSVQHWAAASLVYGKANLDQGAAECVENPAVVALRGKVRIEADPGLASDAAVVSARMTDGRDLTVSVEHCIGSHERPMTDAELDDKFMAQAVLLLPAAISRELLATCRNVMESGDVGSIARQFFRAGEKRAIA